MRPDGGVRPDGGMRPDAGGADAGDPPVGDAGSDAGTQGDAGTPVTGTTTWTAYGVETLTPTVNRGCGCGATPGLDLLGLVALLGFWRRK